jgi:hypothetical protein
MLEYLAVFDGESRPKLIKRVSTTPPVDTVVVYENAEERSAFGLETLYGHMDNLTSYISIKAQSLGVVHNYDELPDDGWHISGGWGEVEWAKNELQKWWDYTYYAEEDELGEEAGSDV